MTQTGEDVFEPHRRRFATGRTIFALMVREMATTYGRSPGGYVWMVLGPALGIALISYLSGFVMRQPMLGTNFPYFYASGIMVFTAYNDIQSKTMGALRYSRSLLAYPAVTYVDAIVARVALASVTHAVVSILVFAGIIWFYALPVILRPGYLVGAFALAVLLGLGIGTLNCVLMSFLPVWERIWGVLMRPMFFISAIFFTFESLSSQVQAVLWFNPVVHLVGLMRAGLFPTYDANYVSVAYVAGIGLVSLGFGMIFLNRYHREIINDR